MRQIVLAALMLLAACVQTQAVEQPPAPTEQTAGIVFVDLGETADLGGGLRVRPLQVLEDSRCPEDVVCVWAGRVRLSVAISGVGEREINSGEPVATPRGAFVLAEVAPPRRRDGPPPAYRFGFRQQ
jgi:hypothetical protein